MLLKLVANFYRLLPIKGGQTRLSFNPFINRLMRDCHDPMVARLWDGSEILVDPHDYTGRTLFLFGTNDIKVSLTSNAFLQAGDVFLDIGANYSTIGLHASRAVGADGTVHLFEPQQRIADRVGAAIREGGYGNVLLHRCGLLDVEATLTIRSPRDNSGSATFAEHGDASDFDLEEECPVHEIGRYVAPLVAGRRFGAKLDIEGSELRIMPWLLRQPNLAFLIFEANQNQRQLYDLVVESGLSLFGLERTVVRLRIRRVDNLDEMLRHHDLIALRLKPESDVPVCVNPGDVVPLMAAPERS
jgi:FkbM family methyltransferase